MIMGYPRRSVKRARRSGLRIGLGGRFGLSEIGEKVAGYESSGVEECADLLFPPIIDPVLETALVNVTASIEFF
jgi:hypothetical protein